MGSFRLRVENMERQLANLTGLVQKALTQPIGSHLQVPGKETYRGSCFSSYHFLFRKKLLVNVTWNDIKIVIISK